jgi:tetratricopeptide (TPR) repeat protein
LILLLFFRVAPAQTVQDRMTPIASALRERNYDEALRLLRPALAAAPGESQLWTMQGAAYDGQGHKNEALASFQHALRISPDNVTALEGAAQIEYEAGNPAGIPLLEHILRLRPGDLTTHAMLAVLEYQQGDCSVAVVHFEKAAALFASQVQALHAYGACLVKLRRIDQAVGVFGNSLTLNPNDRHERQILASVQLMAHQSEQALATLGPLQGTDADPLSLQLASAAYEDLHDTDKAVDALQQAILLDPRNVNLYVNFAALSSTHQSFQVGIDVVNDGISLQPAAAPLYFARGVLYVQTAEYEKAQADFDKAYDLDPGQTLSIAAQGLAAVQQNDLPRALEGVQQKLARRPDDPILLYMQSDILVEQGADPGSPEFQTAMRSARRAVELRPSLGPARGVLAKLYLKNGQYVEAAAQCKKALELDPNDQAAVYHLIQALRKTDRRDEIPGLLKRLAALRQQATTEERQQYRYKLIEGEPSLK